MSFAWPWFFLALPLPWLLRLWLAPVDANLALRVTRLPGGAAAATAPRWAWSQSLSMAALAWALLVGASARPQMPGELQVQPVSGRDLMLGFDVSASMGSPDLALKGQATTRLQVAQTLAADFLKRRQGDRIGLIVFGSQAYLHTPLTFDLDAVGAALTTIDVGFAGPQTALGDAIGLATKHLQPLAQHSRELVLLTDGANSAGTLVPQRAAWLAQRAGVRIHAVGIGAAAAPADTEASPSAAALDEATLQQIAEQTGGSYQRATDSAAIKAFFDRLAQLEPGAQGSVTLRPARELYPWPLALALALTFWLVWRRSREALA